jgi:hypothetical protein
MITKINFTLRFVMRKHKLSNITSMVCDSTAFSLNFTLLLSAAELCRTAQAYCVMLRAEICAICTFSTSTAGLLGLGEGDGTAAGAAAAPEPAVPLAAGRVVLLLLPGTAAGTAGQLAGSIGTTVVALTAVAAASAVSFRPWGLMVASSTACRQATSAEQSADETVPADSSSVASSKAHNGSVEFQTALGV